MAWILVKDNKVVNYIEYDGVSPYTPSDGSVLIEYNGPYDIGWVWDGTNAISPPITNSTGD